MKYKVKNDNIFNVGIRFANEANREITIPHKSFVIMEEDDIFYTNTVSTLFSKGVIYVEDEEIMQKMGYNEKNPNVLSDEDIIKILKSPNPKLKKELKVITESHAINKVIAHAKKLDLPASKLVIIKEQFGKDIFEEIDQEIV